MEIQLDSVAKKFNREWIFRKVNLQFEQQDTIAVTGPNGSGKSTLLKLISGILSPSRGEVIVNGKISALLELGSGFNPEFTGLQNIFFYGTILGLSKKEMEKKIGDIVAFADIGEYINQPLKNYSSGMKSRLGFAVAVHVDPEILILDEVLAVGDIFFRRKCYAKMEEFFKGGKTVIYVSHDINTIIELCSRAILLESGKVLLDHDARTVTTYHEKLMFSSGSKARQIKKEIATLVT